MGENSFVQIDCVGKQSLPGLLIRLLELSSDGIVVTNGAQRIIYANNLARGLLAEGNEIVGDVITSFLIPDGKSYEMDFPTDGSPVLARTVHGLPLMVRCDTVNAPGDTLLYVIHERDANIGRARRALALVELEAANRRLSGILNIVLSTLDALDVPELISRVLEQLTTTMEGSGAILYLATTTGFHLRGISASLSGRNIPQYLPAGQGIQMMCVTAGHALRIHMQAPSSQNLRTGSLAFRTAVDEETGRQQDIPMGMLLPFESMICVPIWFNSHAVALVAVGWDIRHPSHRDDARLLDAVGKYLSTQIAGALSALRTRRSQELYSFGSSLHDRLAAVPNITMDDIKQVAQAACEELSATFSLVEINTHQGVVIAQLPKSGMHSLPVDLTKLISKNEDDSVSVVALDAGKEALTLTSYLQQLGEPCRGAVVDMGELFGEHQCFLALRPLEDEPFDDIELGFLRRIAEGIREVLEGQIARTQDKHISQALQLGMRSELQEVEGIDAEGVYSSSTADAYVGGDFYDLIRLPKWFACVIMGDVSGKGVEAASVSAAVRTALGAYAWQGLSPARMVRTLNRFLLGFSRLETFATLFVGIVDLRKGVLTYCSAGHPPALLVRAHTNMVETLDVQSGVVGAFEEMHYQDGVVQLNTGDTLVLYTDGVTEARDKNGAFFGEDGLREAVMREIEVGPKGLLNRLLATLDVFTGRNLEDDVAMVRLTIAESPDASSK